MTKMILGNAFFKHLLLIASMLFTLPALAIDEINKTFIGNVAIEGYDPVAYFTESRPVKGDSQFEYKWKDANWRFSSAENLALFKENPEQYAPQFGGYCAYAVAKNTTASIDPSQFAVVDGKLYLNFNAAVSKKWNANRDNFIVDANNNWPKLLAQ